MLVLYTLYNKLVTECVTPGFLWLPTSCRGYMYELKLKKVFGIEHMIQQSTKWWLHSFDINGRFSLRIRKGRSKSLWNSTSILYYPVICRARDHLLYIVVYGIRITEAVARIITCRQCIY